MTNLPAISASTAAALILQGSLSAEALMQRLLGRIEARDEAVQAWAFLDRDVALAAARAADAAPGEGLLHGVPVGLKDVIDAAGMPTQYGAAAFQDHFPAGDAEVTTRLRAAGAVIMGKLVTAEFATYQPGPTRNPHNPAHTPGGSSSGSAAAVADGQVPVALGTQTAGSVIRPASFCGVFGYKPSFGRYPCGGVIETSHRLDTMGIFARAVSDVVLLDQVLSGDASVADAPARPLRIGVLGSGIWASAGPAMRQLLERQAADFAAAGHAPVAVESPQWLDDLGEAQKLIHAYECAGLLGHIRREHPGGVSALFHAFIDTGEAIAEADYAEACRLQDAAKAQEADLFGDCDVLLAPSALGTAPAGIDSTGDPVFCRPWTMMGVPCLGFPAGSENGLPLGLQLIGRRGGDAALLAMAAVLLGDAAAPLPAKT